MLMSFEHGTKCVWIKKCIESWSVECLIRFFGLFTYWMIRQILIKPRNRFNFKATIIVFATWGQRSKRKTQHWHAVLSPNSNHGCQINFIYNIYDMIILHHQIRSCITAVPFATSQKTQKLRQETKIIFTHSPGTEEWDWTKTLSCGL